LMVDKRQHGTAEAAGAIDRSLLRRPCDRSGSRVDGAMASAF
jgi:hypothetical protein